MRDVPPEIDAAFYGGRRTHEVPFAINDAVAIVAGPHAGEGVAVTSIEAMRPFVTFLVETAEGEDVLVSGSSLRALGTAGYPAHATDRFRRQLMRQALGRQASVRSAAIRLETPPPQE